MRLSRVTQNALALTTLQAVGYVLPVLMIPYLTRTLGVDSWGKLAMVTAISGYAGTFVNWGFTFSATKKVAASRGDDNEVSRLLMSTWAAQFFLLSVVFVLLLLTIFLFDQFRRDAGLYLLGFLGVFGSTLFVSWFFSGIERIRELALTQIALRVASALATIALVRAPEDLNLLLTINGAFSIVGGIYSICWLIRNANITWTLPELANVIGELRDGAAVFSTTLFVSFYTILTPFVIGVFTGPAGAGYYSVADKIKMAVISASSPISQSVFPRISYLVNHSGSSAATLLIKSAAFMILISTAGSISLFVFSDQIVYLVAGSKYAESATLLRWMSPLPVIITLSNILAIQMMIPTGHIKGMNIILASAGLLSFVGIYFWISNMGLTGAVINFLCVESTVTALLGWYVWSRRDQILSKFAKAASTPPQP